MIISVTEIETYQRCRRKWDLSSLNRQSLSPIINAPALTLGTIVHAALAWWRENPLAEGEDVVQMYKAIATSEMLRIIDAYQKNVGVTPTKDELVDVDNAINMGAEMIANYVAVWGKPIPDGYNFVSNEQTLLVDIPGTPHCATEVNGRCTCDSVVCSCEDDGCWQIGPNVANPRCSCWKYHQLEATLDGLLADEKARYFILECKTFSRTPTQSELDHKFQFVAYMWALEQTGIKARAMLYDGLFKSDHQRRGHKLEDNFLRKLLVRHDAEVDQVGRHLAQLASEMADPTLVGDKLYTHVPVLGGCWDCSYQSLCDAMSQGGNVEYARSRYYAHDYKEWHASEVWKRATTMLVEQ